MPDRMIPGMFPEFDLPKNLPPGTYDTKQDPDGKYRLVDQPTIPPNDINLYDYEHITRERYETIIEATYKDLHTRVMSGSSQGSSALSLLLDQIRALEALRDHQFPEPTKMSIAEQMAVIRLQQAKFGRMTAKGLDADHTPQPAARRGSAYYGKCEVCNRMCQQLNSGWVHSHIK